MDLAVILSFAALYGWLAHVIARRICRIYTHEEGLLAEVVIFASAAVSAAGVGLGEEWSLLMENYRLSSGHLSYRVMRIPWTHHRLGLFVGGVVLFCLLSALHHRLAIRATD